MNKIKVSVIVLIYNPNLNRLKYTLNSIALQKDIGYEVIISDDGSEKIDIKEIEKITNEILKSVPIKYRWAEKNLGTVYNYYEAVKMAEGEYVYGISPGDYIYDCTVIRDMYNFAVDNKAIVCFGNVQKYEVEGNDIKLLKNRMPMTPIIYSPLKYNKTFIKVAFFNGQYVIGAAYFRKREEFEYKLSQIVGKVKYLEDMATSYLYLLEGTKILYNDRVIVWYESNDGISNNKDHPLYKEFTSDEKSVKTMIINLYGSEPIVDFKWKSHRILRFINHPIIGMCAIINKVFKMLGKEMKINNNIIEEYYKIINYI